MYNKSMMDRGPLCLINGTFTLYSREPPSLESFNEMLDMCRSDRGKKRLTDVCQIPNVIA